MENQKTLVKNRNILLENKYVHEDYSSRLKELNKTFKLSNDPTKLIQTAREFIAIIIYDMEAINIFI